MDIEHWVDWDSLNKKRWHSIHELIVPDRQPTLPPKPGGFDFHDGTEQGWTLDQLYDQEEKSMPPVIPPGCPPGGPFYLCNSQNLALTAWTPFLATPDAKVTQCNIYLNSPDLSTNADWQKISGYSIDLQREITCVMGEPKPPQFWCLLQIYLKNKADGAVKHLAEAEGPNGPFSFHPIELHKTYQFAWNPPTLVAARGDYTVTKLRIRLTSWIPAGIGAGELPLQGAWLVGNINPL